VDGDQCQIKVLNMKLCNDIEELTKSYKRRKISRKKPKKKKKHKNKDE
jgi:hypothetical protein